MAALNDPSVASGVRLGRYPQRGRYDVETIAGIFDACRVCHVAVAGRDGPLVLPTIVGRIERTLYFHGSVLARWLDDANGRNVCVGATLVDGLVLARSAFAHSMNYRSAVVAGRAEDVTETEELLAALRAITEHVCPGRWDDVRAPTEAELRATRVLRVGIDAASAKIRSGPPVDAPGDRERMVWAGEIPLRIVAGAPVPDPALAPGIPLPAYLRSRE